MIKIGNESFVDVEQAKQYIRQLLAKYPVGTQVSDPDDLFFLSEMLKRHPEYDEKFSHGIASLTVIRNPTQKATELQVNTTNGATMRTPWVVCVL